MAGLLDALVGGDGSGGLLNFLRQNAMNQQFPGLQSSDTAQYAPQPQMNPLPAMQPSAQPSPLDNAQWPYGPNGAPSQAYAQAPQQPVQTAQQTLAAPAIAQPSLGDHLLAGLQSFANTNTGGLIGKIVNGVGGLATGERTDPTSQANNLTARALLAKGVPPAVVQAAIVNPEVMKTLVTQTFGPQTVTPLGQGYVADKTGKVTRAYEPDDTLQVVQTGQDAMGNKTYGVFNKGTGEIKPYTPAGASANSSGGLGDMSKTGADYLATVPPAQRGILQGMVDGTIQPPSSFALSKPYWQTMLAAAKNLDPTFDENTWAARHKMTTDIASSGNSSMGGILANGKSSFSHLADLSDSMAGLGNTSHDFPGGGVLATAQNYVGNKLGGSDTQAKIKAINDNLGHYGQESTKFYSGTGGGAEERMNALKEMNPAYTSSEEMAAYLSKEKDLMLARLREKEDDIRKTMGDQYLQQHPVFTPQFQATIDRIDANIAKLNGQKPQTTSVPASPKAGEVQQGYRFKGGNPADKNSWEKVN